MTIQGQEYHNALSHILSTSHMHTAEELQALKGSRGSVTPMTAAHTGDDGSRKASKS